MRAPDIAGGSVKELRKEAQSYFHANTIPELSEVLAAAIVLLPEFVKLLELAHVPYWADPQQLTDNIASLIVGGAIDPAAPYLAQIISGTLDADKLDYMPRDCYMAGLPMPVDVERLLQKLRVIRVPASDLRGYASIGIAADRIVGVLAVEASGGRTAEEMVVSRVLLYEKLYHHQKVRALEGIVENALDLLTHSAGLFRLPSTYMALSDEAFLHGRWPQTISATSEIQTARQLLASLEHRGNLIRVFAFGTPMIPPGVANAGRMWRKLRPSVSRSRPAQAFEFRRRLVEKARSYLRDAGQPGLAEELSEHDLVIDLPEPQGITQKTNFYIGSDSAKLEIYADKFNVSRWAEAYESQKNIGYVYAPPAYGAAVHIAARDLIFEETGLVFGPESLTATKVRPSDFHEFLPALRKRRPAIADIGAPTLREEDPAPVLENDILLKHGESVSDLAVRFQTFQPHTGERINRRRIIDWLSQFPSEEIPLAVRILRAIRYWDRRSVIDAFKAGIEHLFPPDSEVQVVPLGGASTSAQHLGYIWPDVSSTARIKGIRILPTPNDVQAAKPILFYDDNVGSGRQGVTVIQQWCGEPREQWEVLEEHATALAPEVRRRLRLCPVAFLFVTGLTQGLQHLTQRATQLLRLENVRGHIVDPIDLGCFRPAARVFENDEQADRARSAFEAAGRRALAVKSREWEPATTAGRLLGYGNAEGLNVFHYNVPTTTLTALWQECTVGPSWTALFPRRRRV